LAAVLVGIAGGSGSGKTTLAQAVAQAFGDATAVVIPHDAYYRDLAHLSFEERARHNFDEPAALDNERLIEDLGCLRRGDSIELPQYDFTNHVRSRGSFNIAPRPLVIVEGILVLAVDELRALFDLCVFVDASTETRLHRRIVRDQVERGRSPESVVAQYERTTLPMHERFIAPSRQYAQLLVSGEIELENTTATIVTCLRRCMRQG
jgi:uridine kinase